MEQRAEDPNFDLRAEDEAKPPTNRALSGAYPAGSTIKPFMALMALQLGKRTPEYTISDPGFYMLAGLARPFRDWKVGGHGAVNLHKSIVVSCDTYYYGLAADMDVDQQHAFLSQVGFGSPSGIDIDGEKGGLLPSREWKKKRFKRPDEQKWYAGDSVSVGIGQGYMLATPLQLAFASAIVANNGVVYRPHVVSQVVDARSGETRRIEPQPVRTVALNQKWVNIVKAAMGPIFYTPVEKRAVLVDHNEISQAVEGIEEAEILEIIDHHRVGDISTVAPIYIYNDPVRSTCTLVAGTIFLYHVRVPADIAGLLLSGILSDTLLLTLSTTTERYRQTAEKLAEIAGVSLKDYGKELLQASINTVGKSASELIAADFREFQVGGKNLGVSQMMVLDCEEVDLREEELLDELERIRSSRGYDLAALLVTNPLSSGHERVLVKGETWMLLRIVLVVTHN